MTTSLRSTSLAKSLAVLLTLVAWLPFAQTTWAETTPEKEYIVAIGDTLSVEVFGHEDLSGECQVDGNGRCSLPLINFVGAVGLTVSELERAVVDRLRPDYLKNPQVRVKVIEYRPIFILGEVRRPGSYPYSVGMTVVNAVALAGGYTYRAARRKIAVTRADDEVGNGELKGENIVLQPGDVIEVPERFF